MQSSEFFRGRQYHIGVGPGDIERHVLLCGDPERASRIAARFDPGSIVCRAAHREFVTISGSYEGVPMTVLATGIGTDNTEIAVIEASQLVERPVFIRVGSCGAIREDVRIGDLVISRDAIPREATAAFYLPEGTRVAGDPMIADFLAAAASRFGYPHHVGTTCSTASFYAGQGREVPGFPIREDAKRDALFPKLLAEGVINFEMETSTLFTLARISTRGIRAGSVCAVFAERTARKFDLALIPEAERRVIDVGLEAMRLFAAAEVRPARRTRAAPKRRR